MKKFVLVLILVSAFLLIETIQAGIPKSGFVEKYLGVSEQEFLKLPKEKQLRFFDESSNSIVNCKTKKKFPCGKFETKTLSELRTQTKGLTPGIKPGTFSVRQGTLTTLRSWFFADVDICSLELSSENIGAFFQVASNLNCLEASGNPQQGVEVYLQTIAQGELAVLQTIPALLSRAYFIEHVAKDGNVHIGQLEQQIELLSGLDDIVPVNNGYAIFYGKTDIPPVDTKRFDQMKVAAHTDVVVNNKLDQTIHQIFTAGIDLNPWHNVGQHNHGKPGVEQIAKKQLQASYEGTIRAAVAEVEASRIGRGGQATTTVQQKLYLTLVGCGVFKNNVEWVADAIDNPEIIQLIQNSGLEVVLIVYDGRSNIEVDFVKFQSRMLRCVQQTGGKYTVYDDRGKQQLVPAILG
jgi:hypothetical protein